MEAALPDSPGVVIQNDEELLRFLEIQAVAILHPAESLRDLLGYAARLLLIVIPKQEIDAAVELRTDGECTLDVNVAKHVSDVIHGVVFLHHAVPAIDHLLVLLVHGRERTLAEANDGLRSPMLISREQQLRFRFCHRADLRAMSTHLSEL